MRPFYHLLMYTVLSLSFKTSAAVYHDISYKECPKELCHLIDREMKKFSFQSLTPEGIVSLGLNHTYLDDKNEGHISIKFGVAGDFEVGRIYELKSGKVLHLKFGKETLAFFFGEIPSQKAEALFSSLRLLSSKHQGSLWTSFSLISNAHAEDCPLPQQAQLTDNETYRAMQDVSVSTVASALVNCLKNSGNDLKKSLNEIVDVLTGSQEISSYYDTISGAINGIKDFFTLTALCILDPIKGQELMGKKLGELGTQMAMTFKMMTSLPLEQKIEMACSFILGAGVSSILGAFTGLGVASLALTFKRFTEAAKTLQMIHRLNHVMKYALNGLIDKTTQTRIFRAIANNADIERPLKLIHLAMESGSELASKMAMRGIQCKI